MEQGSQLLGFDAREPPVGAGEEVVLQTTWDAGRRSLYLLRQDINVVASVDPHVWVSALPMESTLGIGFPRRNDAVGLWCDLSAIRDALAAIQKRSQLIAVTVTTSHLDQWRREVLEPSFWPTDPAELDDTWRPIGYDVADASLLSGLSNCGYTPDEKSLLSARFHAHLNEFHLFRNALEADQFRHETDARMPEHQPFFVYGLYVHC
jgi:hypothetical protein